MYDMHHGITHRHRHTHICIYVCVCSHKQGLMYRPKRYSTCYTYWSDNWSRRGSPWYLAVYSSRVALGDIVFVTSETIRIGTLWINGCNPLVQRSNWLLGHFQTLFEPPLSLSHSHNYEQMRQSLYDVDTKWNSSYLPPSYFGGSYDEQQN